MIVQLPTPAPEWTHDMMTTVVSQCEGWASRSDAEIKRRLDLIETTGNILHGFNPSKPPKNPAPVRLAYEDRRKVDIEIDHLDRRVREDRRGKSAQKYLVQILDDIELIYLSILKSL